jgi:threonine/homoserine/homoserine lactone efflux protein
MLGSPIILPSTLASFLLTSFLIEMTPGPNMTYLALVSASDGRRAGFATVLGVAIGLAVVGAIAAIGVAELIQASTLLYEMLRWAGVLFLLCLAWDGWKTPSTSSANIRVAKGRYFLRGLVTNLLNPKAGVFYVAVLPTFIDATARPMAQAMMLTATYVGVATFVHFIIVVLAGTLEPILNNPRRESIARRLLSKVIGSSPFPATTFTEQ